MKIFKTMTNLEKSLFCPNLKTNLTWQTVVLEDLGFARQQTIQFYLDNSNLQSPKEMKDAYEFKKIKIHSNSSQITFILITLSPVFQLHSLGLSK